MSDWTYAWTNLFDNALLRSGSLCTERPSLIILEITTNSTKIKMRGEEKTNITHISIFDLLYY
jgi:hypothetical protein